MKTYTGSCHCGAVRFEADIEELKEAMVCNCSHCHKAGLVLFFVPKENLRVTAGEDNLTDYRFNKKIVHHLFCKTCGIEPFSNNDSFPKRMINLRCLDNLDIDSLTLNKYNGREV